MTKDEWEKFETELEQARQEHGKTYDQWYETANYPDIQDYCRDGYLISRFLRPQEL
jgi:hypothetical protein